MSYIDDAEDALGAISDFFGSIGELFEGDPGGQDASWWNHVDILRAGGWRDMAEQPPSADKLAFFRRYFPEWAGKGGLNDIRRIWSLPERPNAMAILVQGHYHRGAITPGQTRVTGIPFVEYDPRRPSWGKHPETWKQGQYYGTAILVAPALEGPWVIEHVAMTASDLDELQAGRWTAYPVGTRISRPPFVTKEIYSGPQGFYPRDGQGDRTGRSGPGVIASILATATVGASELFGFME